MEAKPTPDQRAAILKQLDSMLVHQTFKNSKRCTALLRYLVEQALDNPSAHIKERTLGIEVFGRDANYDTALNPIVRMTASEIRKRIAQYYHEDNHELELRIELPAGTYTPDFRLIQTPPASIAPPETIPENTMVDASLPPVTERRSESSKRSLRLLMGVIGVVAVVILAGIAYRYKDTPTTNYARFWYPLTSSPNRVLICMGQAYPPNSTALDSSAKGVETTTKSIRPEIPLNDVNALAKVIRVLENKRKIYELRSTEAIKLADMRAGPVVLIGAFDNGWSMKLLSSLRFHFEEDSKAGVIRIRDTYHPEKSDWTAERRLGEGQVKTDYALVSRYSDELTGNPVLVIAGLESLGTNAAAEFISNPHLLNGMGADMWNCKRNLQVVLKVQIMDGTSGSPQVVTMHCW